MLAFVDTLELWVKLAIALFSLFTASGLAAWIVSSLKKALAKSQRDLIDKATTAGIQAVIQQCLEARCERENPKTWLTLDVHFPNGFCLLVPLFRDGELVAHNITMRVARHSKESTALDLQCNGFGHLPPHYHASTCETIEVREGIVTHVETGTIYRPGQTWVIPAGEMHSAIFQDAWCIVTHRPSLPNGVERPANLSAMPDVFPAEPALTP